MVANDQSMDNENGTSNTSKESRRRGACVSGFVFYLAFSVQLPFERAVLIHSFEKKIRIRKKKADISSDRNRNHDRDTTSGRRAPQLRAHQQPSERPG